MVLALNRVASTLMGEKRVTLRNLEWAAYLQLHSLLVERTHVRLTYDQGTLEITMPLQDHERATRLIELFIRILVVELGLRLKTMGSTTMNREDLQRGAEPDNSYYIQHQPLVTGRKVDFSTDPPPDLIVEVDITHTDINKLEFYASLGVPEFWRFNGVEWRIYQLQEAEGYGECDRSPTFPLVEKSDLYRFLEAAEQDEVAAELSFRDWVRERG